MLPLRRLLAALVFTALPAFAQYTPTAGKNAPDTAYEARADHQNGSVRLEKSDGPVPRDGHGNARGNQYDLAVDGAFKGQTVLIIDQTGNTLVNTRAALEEKGLASVVYPNGKTPTPAELKEALSKSCELWLISNGDARLSDAHLAIIKAFFDAGHGVYIWGDNDPYYLDANRIASALVPGLRMEGDLPAGQIVGVADGRSGAPGVRKGHLVTTGVEHLYEGVTIATIQFTPKDGRTAALYAGSPQSAVRAPALPDGFTPLLYGSASNLVSVAYEKDGKRLVMDGGFTRLAVSWDDAGTARYVKNAAAWLVHAERFKETVATK
ncbi:MAG: phosphoribosyltransferase [Archangiaceae bacterium]|nr:phosphoribosyltransferase [Archangiaceae bacterium]